MSTERYKKENYTRRSGVRKEPQACVGKVKNSSKSYPTRVSIMQSTQKLFKIDNLEYLVS